MDEFGPNTPNAPSSKERPPPSHHEILDPPLSEI